MSMRTAPATPSAPRHPVCPPPPGVACSLSLPEEIVEAIAERAAAIVLTHQTVAAKASFPYLTIMEAASYLRCSRQRVDDLLSARRLTRIKEGGRTLVLQAEIEDYLVRHSRR
jgi:excisionase family DNA binding protein